MGKAKTNEKIKSSMDSYNTAVEGNTGAQGYNKATDMGARGASIMTNQSYDKGVSKGNGLTNKVNNAGYTGAGQQTAASTGSAISKGSQMNAAQNAEAQKYAGQQAAMMGSQQNANAFQNAYGNAYSQQLGNAANNQNTQLANYNNAFENQANRMNSNINNQQQLANANQQYQQNLAATMLGANVTGTGNQVSMQQAQDKQNWSQGGLFSDERLKHYRECSKKVVMKTPSKIQSLKITTKGE